MIEIYPVFAILLLDELLLRLLLRRRQQLALALFCGGCLAWELHALNVPSFARHDVLLDEPDLLAIRKPQPAKKAKQAEASVQPVCQSTERVGEDFLQGEHHGSSQSLHLAQRLLL